jgi:hypothetical protein
VPLSGLILLNYPLRGPESLFEGDSFVSSYPQFVGGTEQIEVFGAHEVRPVAGKPRLAELGASLRGQRLKVFFIKD